MLQAVRLALLGGLYMAVLPIALAEVSAMD